jgi:hypothetical protein
MFLLQVVHLSAKKKVFHFCIAYCSVWILVVTTFLLTFAQFSVWAMHIYVYMCVCVDTHPVEPLFYTFEGTK